MLEACLDADVITAKISLIGDLPRTNRTQAFEVGWLIVPCPDLSMSQDQLGTVAFECGGDDKTVDRLTLNLRDFRGNLREIETHYKHKCNMSLRVLEKL